MTLDDANKEKYRGRKFFLEDAESFVGVNSDQTFVGRILLNFSDYLGDHRIIANLSSIDSFSNFDFTYADLSHRWQLAARGVRPALLPDRRSAAPSTTAGRTSTETGAVASLVYPFSFYHRAEIGVGYILPQGVRPAFGPIDGQPSGFSPRSTTTFRSSRAACGDSAVFAQYGAISGRRWRAERLLCARRPQSGTLYTAADLEVRQYVPLTAAQQLRLPPLRRRGRTATARRRTTSAVSTPCAASTSARWSATGPSSPTSSSASP